MLSRIMQSIESGYDTPGHRIWDVWEDAVGPELARRARPLDFKKGKLTVEVTGAAWLQQLVFLAPQVIEAVNLRLEKQVVETLKPVAAKTFAVEEEHLAALLREGPLGEEEIQRIEAEVGSIGEESLREAVRRARETALRRVRNRSREE